RAGAGDDPRPRTPRRGEGRRVGPEARPDADPGRDARCGGRSGNRPERDRMTADEKTAAPPAAGEPPQPLLRTLAPLLRGLERQVRAWLDARRRFPFTMLQRAELEGLADHLPRQGEALDVDRPLLVVMLMGGTELGRASCRETVG